MKTYKHNTYSYVTVAEIPFPEISKLDFALCKEPTETLESYYNRQTKKPDVLVNGGFFSMADGITSFTYKDEWRNVSEQRYPVGIGITNDNKIMYGAMNTLNVRDFITAYPMLVIDGAVQNSFGDAEELNYKARRTCLGYNSETLYLVTVDMPGLTLNELARLMKDLGCTYAANLDGGGSTRMLVGGKRKTAAQIYNRPVDNVVAVYLKETVKTEHYRVQTGAFAIKANANKYLKQIQALGGLYKDAYIHKDGLLYKVQVGYFAQRINADTMVKDLKSKGVSSYITIE